MPNKYPEKKGWDVPKQKYKVTNWPEYNVCLRRRGEIYVWLSEEAISLWYEKDMVYDRTGGAPRYYSDFAIRTGLWNYSRHSNYFFDWLTWVGFTLFGLQSRLPWNNFTHAFICHIYPNYQAYHGARFSAIKGTKIH